MTSDEPEVKAYRDNVAKHYPNDPIGVFGLNGWSNGALFVKGFQALLASGKPLTRASLVEVMETMNNQTIGGARNVTFKPGDHRGARQEGIIQAMPDGSFKLLREFRPYPGRSLRRPELSRSRSTLTRNHCETAKIWQTFRLAPMPGSMAGWPS